jgi:multicomponent Na+:H+ antiporter subunit G
MIDVVTTSLSWILLAAGAFFYLVAALGLVRMPDVFTRMHANAIADTAGAGLMLAGMMVAAGISLVSVKLLVILAIILFTSPIVTHALAQAAMHAGVEPILAGKGGRSAPGSKTPASKKANPKTRRRGRSRKAKEVSQ